MALYDTYSDNDLFILISRGNESAFTEIFHRYDKRLFPFVLKMVKTEAIAEEIIQEIFIKLWVNRNKLAAIDRPDAYLLTIAFNHTLDQIKKGIKERKMLHELAGRLKNEVSYNTEDTLLLRGSIALVEQAVDQLPPQQKRVYTLSRQQGLKNEEIAKTLAISPNTVRNHLAEALRSIRFYLEEREQIRISLIFSLVVLLQK